MPGHSLKPKKDVKEDSESADRSEHSKLANVPR